MKTKRKIVRPLYAIAYEIKKDWKIPSFSAIPYLEAMGSLRSIEDNYFQDSARSIVLYFLANANTWKGEKARAIKHELKTIAGIA